MPKEFRKRGKKNKKGADKDEWKPPKEDRPLNQDQPEEGRSWIIPASKEEDEVNLEAPFGYIDVNVKAYFRTVDVQIRDWQVNEAEATEDGDPNEERRMFFVAALTEMSDKETQLATDPDCSNVLERMSYSMDDFARRVFVDRLAGSYEVLVKHRFASHVCQTLFTVAADTIAREEKGILPPTTDFPNEGELRTLTEQIPAICEELVPSFTQLIMDPFASHVIRALLLLLSPLANSSNDASKSHQNVRSKKSAAWKARQAPMKNVFAEHKSKATEGGNQAITTPKAFKKAAANFVRILREELGANEVRALAANKVASPVLQILLEIEADQCMSDAPDSLMDRVLVGIITLYNEDPSAVPEQSDYLSTLLRDPTSSHLLETLVTRAPERAFVSLWSTYFQGNMSRLAAHNVANFVVARALGRASPEQLSEACQELRDSWAKIIKLSRSGVLKAVIDRAVTLHNSEKEIGEAICTAFELETPEDYNMFVPCVMILKPLSQYRSILAMVPSTPHNGQDDQDRHSKGRTDSSDNPLEPKVQGALLLQSMLLLHEPHNELVTNSIKALPIEDLLKLAHHPTGSRVFDVLFESSTVPYKVKRTFVMSFIDHYHTLVDDRIGSRVGDRCWAFADPYLREKIAKSMFSQEQFLAGSFYGKFFARHLNLYLLQRKPEEWRNLQIQNKAAQALKAAPTPSTTTEPSTEPTPTSDEKSKKKRKRGSAPGNEIDALFDTSLGKKLKRVALNPEDLSAANKTDKQLPAKGDKGLDDILTAIRAAPKGDGDSSRKKKSKQT
ncbi:ARM repeat-containing protein [Athelia psychrophila]|uniref:Nucleolar protein 9 n=1 Tax=Athelia psychrophila TaxID=1759441 RepID=A0A167WAB6_9AGAM|nr:ARM repeat-containing protein [Fibularhizoctonia sp. CBS 109695]